MKPVSRVALTNASAALRRANAEVRLLLSMKLSSSMMSGAGDGESHFLTDHTAWIPRVATPPTPGDAYPASHPQKPTCPLVGVT